MKKRFILTSAILALLLCACGGEGEETKTTEAVTGGATEAVTEAGYTDNLPADLDFGGYNIRALMASGYTQTFTVTGEDSADVINELIFNRNIKMQERLNVTLEPIRVEETPWATMTDMVRTSVMAGSDDYDLVGGALWYTQGLMFGDYMYNLYDAPYIDITTDWWSTDYIEGMSWEDYRYWLCGPMDLTYISATCCIYANLPLFNNHYDEDLYDLVFDGKWTLDRMNQYATDIYQDLDSSGDASEGDLMGFVIENDLSLEPYVYACGIDITALDENGNMYLALTEDPEPVINFWDKWIDIQNNSTFLKVTWSEQLQATSTVGNDMFIEGNLLFRYGTLGNSSSTWRDMEDDYAILPMPKYDEAQENYIGVYRDSLNLFGAPMTITEQALNASCAFMEACAAYSYDTIIPAYMDNALKNKYLRDERSVEVIDMLAKQPVCNFGAEVRDLGFSDFLKTLYGKDNITSQLASQTKKFEKTLEKILSGDTISTAY